MNQFQLTDGIAEAMLSIVAEAKAMQEKFLATQGMTMAQARALQDDARLILQAAYAAWVEEQKELES